ncbi:MAG: DUF3299 domain-containing protein [Alphaproteobacteria bacterium]|jgi:hypothetical protein|nr:DUF3299 domain-containing protein [Alphaproteobacteria bacterium]
MTRSRILLLLLAGFLWAAAAPGALAFQTQEEARAFYQDLVNRLKSTVTWQTLGEYELEYESKGPGMTVFRTRFPDKVKALDGSKVTIAGFLFPLQGGETHERFLLSAYPPSCPFCLPAGPRELIEVEAEEGVDFTYDPIVLEGKFTILKDDPSGLFYRLIAARAVDD